MPYPDYEEIQDVRKRRTKQEIEGGRQRVLRDMAERLLERICQDYGLQSIKLESSNPDPRMWTAMVDDEHLPQIEESFWAFPSQEFMATLILAGKVKK